MIQLDVILLFVNFMLNIKNLDSSFQVFCAFNFISKFTTTNQKLKYCNRLADRETFFSIKISSKTKLFESFEHPSIENSCKYQAHSPLHNKKK